MGCGSSQPAVDEQPPQQHTTTAAHANPPPTHTTGPKLAEEHKEQQPLQQPALPIVTATTVLTVVAPSSSSPAVVVVSPQPTTAAAPLSPAASSLPSSPSDAPSMSQASIAHYSQVLSTVPLLAKLTQAERTQLTTVLTPKRYRPSEAIIIEGEPGYGFFIIAKGDVVVYKNSERKGEKVKIAALKEGDFFGETALINNAKRGASVSAGVGGVEVLYLEKKNFDSLFGAERLNVQFAKRQAVSAEKHSVGASSSQTPAAGGATEKSVESIKLIHATISGNILFLNLDPDLLSQIISQMYRKEIPAGTNAIVQGDHGDNLYVVESGRFDIFVNKKKVAEREKGTLFGELALMYNSPRAATVQATVASVVWVLDRFTFRRIVTNNNEKKFELYIKFLKRVELLTPLAEYERKKVAEALDEVMYSPGSSIFKQGDEGDAMYIVYSGEVKIVKRDQPDDEPKEVMRCVSSDYFGERALMTRDHRAATAVAVTSVQLLRLDKNAFTSLLGPLEDIMKKKVDSYTDPQQHASARKEAGVSDESRKPQPLAQTSIPFTDLVVLGTLGKGSFGYVQLVQSKSTKQTFALKAVSKTQIVKTGQQGHVMSEKKAMSMFDHPFCIKLHGTYKDKDRLYFLLEPSLGGELFSVLRERTLFDEDTARFYAGSVILAFEYIHNLHYCYRDLKPENLLLDAQGYLKVTDFGFAKDISSGRTWTLCGTPDYLAPEIVAGKGHGKAVDWWTVGVFIYEMLASYPPFYDEDPMRTYAKIMRGAVTYPSHFSKNAISLIAGLLQAKPTRRLGALKGGVTEIKSHAWFEGFDWERLIKQKMPAPILPKIKNDFDLSNFDDYSKQAAPQIQPYVDDGSNWDADF